MVYTDKMLELIRNIILYKRSWRKLGITRTNKFRAWSCHI